MIKLFFAQLFSLIKIKNKKTLSSLTFPSGNSRFPPEWQGPVFGPGWRGPGALPSLLDPIQYIDPRVQL